MRQKKELTLKKNIELLKKQVKIKELEIIAMKSQLAVMVAKLEVL